MLRSLSFVLPLALLACPPPEEPPAPPPDPAEVMVDDLAALRLSELGNPVTKWDWLPPVEAAATAPHELLVVLVEFPDVQFDRFAGEEDQGEKLRAFYQEQLFDDLYQRPDTLSHYYATQSAKRYHLVGRVLPPVVLDEPLAAYGSPHRPEGGDWRNDVGPEDLVEDALTAAAAAHPDVPWHDHDRWDPKDFDADGITDEPDGYLDHLVLVYAGGGQASCQALHKLHVILNPNVGPEVLDTLSEPARACADRIWPHRFVVKRREFQGPVVDGKQRELGGVPITDDLWAADYNMQSEYTDNSTFIHEFGHSIGLPDLYARTSNNSTGAWDLMSHTTSPSPQGLSAWSRLVLGWLEPRVVLPPSHGGEVEQGFWLSALDDVAHDGVDRAALVVLPPKTRQVDLTELPEASGELAMYSGQGNDLDRSMTVSVDLSQAGEGVELELDAWWEIEAGWDFAYVEARTDGAWTRLVPEDRAHMPAKHGHDGASSLPGFTGLSGDLDGDGKNESHPDCDPDQPILSGEDKADTEENPCEQATWVHPTFDLEPYAGSTVHLRLRYYTDGAAVENGLLVDNLTVTGLVSEGFEGELDPSWEVDGFTPSPGAHTLLVPHYYLLEFRDPSPEDTSTRRYDRAIGKGAWSLFWDPAAQAMGAVRFQPRAGVLAWYFNGSYAWSENDPAINGPGEGFLLLVDSEPNEVRLPVVEDLLAGDVDSRDTRYELKGDEAQARLREGFFRTMCFVRNPEYIPDGLDAQAMAAWCDDGPAGVAQVELDGRPGRYGYEVSDLLPGEERAAWRRVGELFDYRTREGETTYRLRDRTLRFVHTYDAPFMPGPADRALVTYRVAEDLLEEASTSGHLGHPTFSDEDPTRWLNEFLPFGGVNLPMSGLSFEVSEPGESAPDGAEAKVTIRWAQAEPTTP